MHKILAPCIVIKLLVLYPAQKRLHVWECALQTTLLWRKRALRVLVCVLICVSFARCELSEASCSCWRVRERESFMVMLKPQREGCFQVRCIRLPSFFVPVHFPELLKELAEHAHYTLYTHIPVCAASEMTSSLLTGSRSLPLVTCSKA